MKYHIIGFCDVPYKARGWDDITKFRDLDCFVTEQVPKPAELIEYARKRGYYPSGKPGAFDGKCDAVYYYISEATA